MSDLDIKLALKTQIEYYLSDENLIKDKFFFDLIKNSKDGFIPINVFLNCNKIKKISEDLGEIQEAMEKSDQLILNESKTRVSRNKPLPEFNPTLLGVKRENDDKENKEERKGKEEKDEIVIFSIEADKVSEIKWKEIQDGIKSKNPDLEISYLRFSNDSGHLGIFKSKLNKLIEYNINIDDVTITLQKTEGDKLIDFWKCHGGHIEMCLGKEMRKKEKERKEKKENYNENKRENKKEMYKLKKPVQLGNIKFLDIKDIRQKARTILNNIKSDEKAILNDEAFLKDILSYHPNENKGHNFEYFTTGQNPEFKNSLCFFIVKKDGTKEDFSINKCLDVIFEKYGSK